MKGEVVWINIRVIKHSQKQDKTVSCTVYAPNYAFDSVVQLIFVFVKYFSFQHAYFRPQSDVSLSPACGVAF